MGAKSAGGGPERGDSASLKGMPQCAPCEATDEAAVHGEAGLHVQETRKLEAAGAIREVRYPEWLANPVVVPKKGGKE